jgi:hypothetical protein
VLGVQHDSGVQTAYPVGTGESMSLCVRRSDHETDYSLPSNDRSIASSLPHVCITIKKYQIKKGKKLYEVRRNKVNPQ